jgi:hypothetical protein
LSSERPGNPAAGFPTTLVLKKDLYGKYILGEDKVKGLDMQDYWGQLEIPGMTAGFSLER